MIATTTAPPGKGLTRTRTCAVMLLLAAVVTRPTVAKAADGPPQILLQPANASAREGERTTFSAQADGTAPLVFQWQRNGEPIPGQSGSALTIGPLTLSDNGTILSVVVTNGLGSVTSTDAVLTVTPGIVLTASANRSADLVTYRGWPLVIECALLHPNAFDTNATPIAIAATNGPWINALSLKVQDSQNQPVNWNFQAAPFTNDTLMLTSTSGGRMLWWLAPSDTANLAFGDFTILATLSTTNVTRTNAWLGVANSVPIHLSITNEPVPLSGAQTEQKHLLFADYALLTGNSAQAQLEVNALLLSAPTNIGGLRYDAYLKQTAGLFDDALQSLQKALDQVAVRSPDATEPPVELSAKAASLQAMLSPPILTSKLVYQTVLLSWIGYPGLDYRLEVSSNLRTWTSLTTNFNVVGELFSHAVAAGRESQFFRVARQKISTK